MRLLGAADYDPPAARPAVCIKKRLHVAVSSVKPCQPAESTLLALASCLAGPLGNPTLESNLMNSARIAPGKHQQLDTCAPVHEVHDRALRP
jgi:hypothetical protein